VRGQSLLTFLHASSLLLPLLFMIVMPVALLIAGAVAFGAALVLARRASTAERRRGSAHGRDG